MRRREFDIEKCKEIIVSEDYLDLIMETRPSIEEVARRVDAQCYQILTEDYGVFHIKKEPNQCEDFYFYHDYNDGPNVYGLTSTQAMEAAGIGTLYKSEGLNLTGKGVIVGIIDTGIDYTNQVFRNNDGSTRILSIWDQSIIGNPPEGFLYGTEYSREQINEALLDSDPYRIVPSKDTVGHGTYVAGLAAGGWNSIEEFRGAAPGAEIIVVKLKQAKKCLMDFYQFKDGAIAWQTNDIIQALNYVIKKAVQLDKTVAILFTGGSTEGPHMGVDMLEEVLKYIGNFYGVVTVVSAGNEGNAGHHFRGKFGLDQKKMDIQLNIAEGEKGLYMALWTNLPDKLSIEFISPSGYSTGKIPFINRQWQTKEDPLEQTTINIYYDFMEERAAVESIVMLLQNPVPGLWTMIVHGDIVINGEFDVWLPLTGFIDQETLFLKPDPYDTVVSPGNSDGTITVGSYNHLSQSIYLNTSRGFTRDQRVKPDLVAPGVNLLGPYTNNEYVYRSGTSGSAAITAGASALLLEWGVVRGNDDLMNTTSAKAYLARGARRRETINYPNPEWGYGELDLFNTFRII
ncbi:S8 family peptidase [Vallitalea okinawensis]|uniref:S8 family peptidase n=1 Tax=Vallitalea okinawensis TaxID=2078660 RepID=UPI000CFDFAE4|nr:S8 family peptidase [Vallitalea okinawensis]